MALSWKRLLSALVVLIVTFLVSSTSASAHLETLSCTMDRGCMRVCCVHRGCATLPTGLFRSCVVGSFLGCVGCMRCRGRWRAGGCGRRKMALSRRVGKDGSWESLIWIRGAWWHSLMLCRRWVSGSVGSRSLPHSSTLLSAGPYPSYSRSLVPIPSSQ